jgi:hypothetical protein
MLLITRIMFALTFALIGIALGIGAALLCGWVSQSLNPNNPSAWDSGVSIGHVTGLVGFSAGAIAGVLLHDRLNRK